MKPDIARMDLSRERIEAVVERMKPVASEEDFKVLKALVETFLYLSHLIEKTGTTLRRLRRLLFGSKTEKSRNLLGGDSSKEREEEAGEDEKSTSSSPEDEGKKTPPKKKKRKGGNGRNGADAYTSAEKVEISHDTLNSGDPCPVEDCEGKVYQMKQPAVLVRVTGQAPLGATVLELQRLRCNLCGTVFTARAPEGTAPEKYDEKAASIIALLHYGSGLPFNRLQGLQAALGIPLPAATQWEIAARLAGGVEAAYDELVRQAAQGDVVYNDDTTVKILELIKENQEKRNAKEKDVNAGFG